MDSRTSTIAAGVCGALFLGYCIYFDRKRRSDPNFRQKLRERRRQQKTSGDQAGLARLPDLKDAEAVQKFFLEEIQLGEELLAQGKTRPPSLLLSHPVLTTCERPTIALLTAS
ncbi:mitochondrial import receptor subunit TOM20 homolog [Clupea harengus]|uniref:Mitochondrial import receptor subunit TOM20 homolog n=1 Tax=Clupea harengus TaxID=7950 RepID=A0A8M1KNC8_CLUHA|nr:mitochondrial import receptor subunit TOM20 homolog [Clupea harengus]